MSSIEIHAAEHLDQSFNDVLVEQLKKAPWLMVSIIGHVVVFALIWNMEFSKREIQDKKDISAQLEEKNLEELEELDPEIEEEEIEEEEIEEPEIEEVETVTEDVDDSLTDEDSLSDQPFDNRGSLDILGIGGGSGSSFRGRSAGRKSGKGGARANRAVEWGLEWLAKAQSPDGRWDSDGYEANLDGPCPGKGHALYDPGVSGLALLAFLGAGYTHSEGRYKDTVKNGLKYLKDIQDPEGCFGDRLAHNFTYGHAICALAMAEAYGQTAFPLFKRTAQKGIDFIAQSRNPGAAWRYGVQPGDSDSSVTGWMVMALKSGKLAGLDVDPDCFKGARDFIDSVTDEYGGAGYTMRGSGSVRLEHLLDEYPIQYSQALTAVCMTSRVFMSEDPTKSEPIKKGANLLAALTPVWDKPKIDMYYWYYGTLAMHQVGGTQWEKWNQAMQKAIIEHQETEGVAKGSWEPIGAWGEEGGRVYSTALMTMCLEVYYRYDKVFGASDRK
jgi:hypothetical protein